MPLSITSPDFRHESAIPRSFTCEGSDRSPVLHWRGVPDGAKSLALIVEDPDAPDPEAPQRIFTHWLVYDLPADTGGVDDGVMPDQLPGEAKLGKNDFGKLAWGGPCPPIGEHRYFFKLFALDCSLSDLKTPDRDALYRAMEGHVLEEATLMGTYEKHDD